MNTSKKQLFIGIGLHGLYDYSDGFTGVVNLRNRIEISLIKKEYGEIKDGQKLWLYFNSKNKGKIDPTILPGFIYYKGKNREDNEEYEIKVDEKDFMYLSESEEFRSYLPEDIFVWEKMYNIEEKKLRR